MITLRCTQKLRKYLGIVPVDIPELSTAVLGDWYVNLVPTFSGDLIIFLSEKTLLTVAIPIWESNNLVPIFRMRVVNLLGMIGVHPKDIANEIIHFDQVQYTKTDSDSKDQTKVQKVSDALSLLNAGPNDDLQPFGSVTPNGQSDE